MKVALSAQNRERAVVARILVIDDDGEIRELLREVFSDAGYEVLFVDDLDHAPADAAPDLVFSDLVGLGGYESGRARASVHRVQARYPGIPIIVCTGHDQALTESDRLGASAVLGKPFAIETLFGAVARLLPR